MARQQGDPRFRVPNATSTETGLHPGRDSSIHPGARKQRARRPRGDDEDAAANASHCCELDDNRREWGTSADQDTRFSNKKAKLLKTQKFAPDLEHLVDMTKVKMDVMKPWIATRVTELLGFEDEVLINFIFGLLEGKDVNGKEVQISLTGFMEKNTGKFMKELWALLLSAQQNSSGVPQQFLDAKEEETRKKMEEADRIANEIQKKREKESRDMDQERVRNMDGVVEKKTANSLDHSPRASNGHRNEKSNNLKRDGERGAAREMPRSRSSSKSARARSHSVSSDKSPRSLSPDNRRSPHRSHSPPRRGYSYYRRSRSPIRRRSPSPARRRLQSPRRRSRSPGYRRHRRTPSPGWRRRTLSSSRRRRSPSPVRRRRSPSPVRHRRSPPVRRRRSPTPVRRRGTPSPDRRRGTPSPVRRRRTPSPVRRSSTPSPVHHRRSLSPLHQRSSSFESQKSLSPARRRSSISQHRSPSSGRKRTTFPINRRLLSPVRRRSGSPLQRKSLSPVLDELPLPSRQISSPRTGRKGRSPSSSSERSPIPARGRSPLPGGRSQLRARDRSVTPSDKSLSLKSSSPSPVGRGSLSPHMKRPLSKRSSGASSREKTRERSLSPYKNPKKQDIRQPEDRRPTSPYRSSVRQVKDRVRRDVASSPEKPGVRRRRFDSPEGLENSNNVRQKLSDNSSSPERHSNSPRKMENKDSSPAAKAVGHRISESRNNDQERGRGKSSVSGAYSESADGVKSQNIDKDSPAKKHVSDRVGVGKSDEKYLQLSNTAKEDDRKRSRVTEEQTDVPVAVSDGSDDNAHGRKEKRRNKRSKRHDTGSNDESNDSEAKDRKESKRRRRAERKLRKEEKRRRREERRGKREGRHAEKYKLKRGDSSSPSDADPSDSPHAKRSEIPSGENEVDAKQKKLEVELRLKALESFKSKKSSNR